MSSKNERKKGLGRGLSSLIGETKLEPQKNQLSVTDIIPNKYQPRKIRRIQFGLIQCDFFSWLVFQFDKYF